MSVVKSGEKILVPRNVHKSVTAAIILSGAEPIYMNPEIDDDLGIAHGVKSETVENMLKQHSDIKELKEAELHIQEMDDPELEYINVIEEYLEVDNLHISFDIDVLNPEYAP